MFFFFKREEREGEKLGFNWFPETERPDAALKNALFCPVGKQKGLLLAVGNSTT